MLGKQVMIQTSSPSKHAVHRKPIDPFDVILYKKITDLSAGHD